jgi:hypothetical protein
MAEGTADTDTGDDPTFTPEPTPAPAVAGAGYRPQAPPLGPADPLSAAYCAERAAQSVHQAEVAPFGPNEMWLQCADRWIALAAAVASSPVMARPRDNNNPDTRR